MLQGKCHNHFSYIILLAFLLFAAKFTFSQSKSEEYVVESIPYKGELAGFSGRCMFQDSDGFMWFGSTGGLYRYDGKNFKIFRHDPDNELSISNDEINYMIEDEEGVIWIGTRWGFNKFEKQGGYFKQFYSQLKDTSSLIQNRVLILFQDAEYNIWLGTMSGLAIFDKSTESFINYQSSNIFLADKRDIKNITSIIQDKEGYLWIHGTEGGLWRFDNKSGLYDKVENTPCHVMNMELDSKERFWIAGKDGLYLFNTDALTFKRMLYEQGDPNRLRNQSVRSILEDKSGNLWIRTLDGFYKYSHDLELLFHWEHLHLYPDTKQNELITRNMYEDRMGTIWFYTEEGIGKCYKSNYHFNLHRPDLFVTGGIVSENESSIWFGTDKGLYQFNRPRNAYTHYQLDSLELEVSALCKDRNGSLWIGTWGEGLFKFEDTNNESKNIHRYLPIPGDSSSVSGNNVWQIIEDHSGRLWISGFDQNPCYYDLERDRMIHLVHNTSSGEQFPSDLIIFHESNENELWALGDSAIYIIKPPFNKVSENAVTANKVIQYSEIVIGGEIRYWRDIICAMLMDSKGIIWLGTPSHGLQKVLEGKLKSYTTSDGLLNNWITSIIEDASGNIWLGTYNGLSKFEPANEGFTNYTTQHGLTPTRFTTNSTCKSNDELFFGTHSGMISFYPDSLTINKTMPPVFITDLMINNQATSLEKFVELRESLIVKKEIKLAYNQNFLSIEFAALNYIMPEQNQFKYKLVGLEDDWVYCGGRNVVSYSSLRSGKYTFMVTGANNDGIWNPTGTSLGITITPPPWFSWWAYVIYGFIIMLLIRWYRGFLIKREKISADLRIKEIEINKMQEVDQLKNQFFANISHEFRTPLTLILGPVEKLINSKNDKIELPRKSARIIFRNATRLHRLINQLLDFSKLEAGKVSLKVSEGDLVDFSRTIILSYISLAESKMICYKYALPTDCHTVFFDRDKVEKILINLISNAFKFTPEGGTIEVKMATIKSSPSAAPDCVIFGISDTGMGIPPDQLEKVFHRFYRVNETDTGDTEGTGIGLALAKELVDLYRGNITVESELGKGCCFTVRLPVSEDSFTSDEVKMEPTVLPYETIDPERIVSEEPSVMVPGQDKPVILVVEDFADMRNYIAENLDANYHILLANNGLSGLEKALECIPDLIISDVMMPGMDGMALCGKLKTDERTNHIPLILLTARAERESKIDGLTEGADDYLVKPFDMGELQVRIKNLLEQRIKLREKFRMDFFSVNGDEGFPVENPFLKKLLAIFDQHLADPEFKISQLSGELNLSRSQIFRKVTNLTGYSPVELFRNQRLAKAADLFRSGQDQVATVMYSVGFNHQSYFTKCFSELYGKTPMKFIRDLHSTA